MTETRGSFGTVLPRWEIAGDRVTIAPGWAPALVGLLLPVGVWLSMQAFQEGDGRILIPPAVACVVFGFTGLLMSPLRPGSRIVVARDGVSLGRRRYPADEVVAIEARERVIATGDRPRRQWLLSIELKSAPAFEKVLAVGEPGAVYEVVAAMNAVLQRSQARGEEAKASVASGGEASAALPTTPVPGHDRAAWQSRLLAYVRERHAARPIAPREALDPLQLAMFNVEGGFLTTWLRQYGPQMLGERRVLLEDHGELAPQPIIVVHGDLPAVAAVLQIAGAHATTGEKRLVVLLDEDYEAFVRESPEAREFDFHISSWSRFVPAAPALLERARTLGHAIDPALTYYNHVNGTLWGPRHGLEVENLWSWDGTRLDLVEEAIVHRRF